VRPGCKLKFATLGKKTIFESTNRKNYVSRKNKPVFQCFRKSHICVFCRVSSIGVGLFFLIMTYQEKLKHPKWQQKRLKILERDSWRCQTCGDENNSLHVHHIEYGKEPWSVSDDNLITLCESCHAEVERILSWLNIKPKHFFVACYFIWYLDSDMYGQVGVVDMINREYIDMPSHIWAEIIETYLNRNDGRI